MLLICTRRHLRKWITEEEQKKMKRDFIECCPIRIQVANSSKKQNGLLTSRYAGASATTCVRDGFKIMQIKYIKKFSKTGLYPANSATLVLSNGIQIRTFC